MPSFASLAYNPYIYPPDWPLALVTSVLPLPDMFWLVLYYFLGGLGLYLLCREWGAGRAAATLGGIAFLSMPNLVAVGAHGHGSQLVDSASSMAANHAEAERALVVVNSELARYRGAVIAVFAPAVALALLGALAGARRKMGRIAGLLAIALGLVNAGIWLVFFDVAIDEPDVRVNLGYGLHVLLIAGIFGALAGIGALLAPDRGLDAD